MTEEHFSIGKTCVSNILRNAKPLQWEYEFSKENCKKLRHEQYHLINKYAGANVFSDGPMLKKEAMLIKERLNKDELATFTASNDWLEKFEPTCRLYETRITGEVDDIPRMTIQSWIEGLPEQTSGYWLRSMDELGLFSKDLPEKIAF